jgi:uncharacterized metal-binding protein
VCLPGSAKDTSFVVRCESLGLAPVPAADGCTPIWLTELLEDAGIPVDMVLVLVGDLGVSSSTTLSYIGFVRGGYDAV